MTARIRKPRQLTVPKAQTGWPRLPDIALWAALVAITLIAYFPALHGTLLWDDDAYVTRPGLRTLHGLWVIWSDPKATEQYYPLLHTAFWIEHMLFGDAVLAYHVINVLLHAGSAFLVVLIVRRLRLPGAWLAGAIFALHPICVESIAWITEQKNTVLGAQGPEYSLPVVQKFLLAGRAAWFYIGKLLWPANLMFTYPRWNIKPRVW